VLKIKKEIEKYLAIWKAVTEYKKLKKFWE
jgi:hypothetical protein